MARVAYGERKKVCSAIDSGVIPPDTLIITKGDTDPEMLFYDADGNLMPLAERTRFKTLTEAEQWAKNYPCAGFIFMVQDGSEWLPYIVQEDNSLMPFKGEVGDIANIAKTGNINDLIQTKGDYIIFNCGTATTVI